MGDANARRAGNGAAALVPDSHADARLQLAPALPTSGGCSFGTAAAAELERGQVPADGRVGARRARTVKDGEFGSETTPGAARLRAGFGGTGVQAGWEGDGGAEDGEREAENSVREKVGELGDTGLPPVPLPVPPPPTHTHTHTQVTQYGCGAAGAPHQQSRRSCRRTPARARGGEEVAGAALGASPPRGPLRRSE